MATKPLSTWGSSQQSDATRVNTNDRTPTGNLVSDNFGEGNPNAQGPTMRPLYDATARAASHWADQHDANPEDVPYPRVQRGAVAEGSTAARFRGRTGDDERFGPAGQFDPVDYPFAGKTQGKGGNQADDGDANNIMPGIRSAKAKRR